MKTKWPDQSRFVASVRKHFGFLIREFGFVEDHTESDWFGTEIAFRGRRTAVQVEWEVRDKLLSVFVIELVDGAIPPRPVFDTDVSFERWIPIEVLVRQRAPGHIWQGSRNAFGAATLHERAELLRSHGSDYLK